MSVGDTEKRPEADISISDGTTTLNLMLMSRSRRDRTGWQIQNTPSTVLRMDSGASGYASMAQPFTSTVQENWEGGRGLKDLRKDATRYYDGTINTVRGDIRCAPLPTESTGFGDDLSGGSTTTTNTEDCPEPDADPAYYASSFTPASGLTLRGVTFYTQQTYACKYDVYIYPDNGSDGPDTSGSALSANSLVVWGDYSVNEDEVYIAMPEVSLSASTKYWFVIGSWVDLLAWEQANGAAPTGVICWGASTGKTLRYSTFLSIPFGTYQADSALRFTVLAQGEAVIKQFNYKGITMVVKSPGDLSTPSLWANGLYGMALSNSSDKSKLNTGVAISNNIIGCKARIVSGPGSEEQQNWRLITTYNAVTGSITCSPNWLVTHTTSTMYVIEGCNFWQEVTGHGLTTMVKSVEVVDDIIYFGQGPDTNMRRMTYSGGAWDAVADGTNKADFLTLVQASTGEQRIWKALAGTCVVNEAPKQSWSTGSGTNLAFASDLVCGSTNRRITNLIMAKVDNATMPIVFREDGFGAVNGLTSDKIFDYFRYFPEIADVNNGKSAIVHDVYLWLSIVNGSIERYYQDRLDDVGPTRDEGMPRERAGRVSAMVEYTSQVFAAIDAGDHGYSTVLQYNGQGWDEVYRSKYGRHIYSLGIQVISGNNSADRLWIAEEERLIWIPVSINPDQQIDYQYKDGSEIILSRMYGNFYDIPKWWGKFKAMTRNIINAYGYTITFTVWASTDGQNYTEIGTVTEENQELDLSGVTEIEGEYLQLKLVLNTDDPYVSPIIEKIRVDSVTRVDPNEVFTYTVEILDGRSTDRNGAPVDLDAEASYNQLRDWQSGRAYPGRLTLRHAHPIGDNMKGFVQGVTLQPINEEESQEGTTRVLNLMGPCQFQFVKAE